MLPYQFHYPLMNSLVTTPVVPPPLQPSFEAPERFRRSGSEPSARCFELIDDVWSRQRPRQKVVVFKPCDETSTSTPSTTTTLASTTATDRATTRPCTQPTWRRTGDLGFGGYERVDKVVPCPGGQPTARPDSARAPSPTVAGSTSTTTTTVIVPPETAIPRYEGRCYRASVIRHRHPYVVPKDPKPVRIECPPIEPPPGNDVLCPRNYTLATYGLWMKQTFLVPCALDKRSRRSTCEIL